MSGSQPGSARSGAALPGQPYGYGSQPGSATAAAAAAGQWHGYGSQPGSATAARAQAAGHMHAYGSQPGSATAAGAEAAAAPAAFGAADMTGMESAHPEAGQWGAAGVYSAPGYGDAGGPAGPEGGSGWEAGQAAYDGSSIANGGAAGAPAPGGPEAGDYAAHAAYHAAGAEGGAPCEHSAAGVEQGPAAAVVEAPAEGGVAAQDSAAGDAAAGDEGYSPLAYLQQVEAHLASLQQQRRELEGQLAAAAASGYQHMSQQLGTAGTGVRLPHDVPALVDELAVLQAVRQYLAYLQELQALTRHVEKAVRALQQQAQQAQQAGGRRSSDGHGAAAFLQSASEAVDGFSNAVGYAIAVKQLTDQGKVRSSRLQQYAAVLLSRVDLAQRGLRSVLSSAIQQRLAAAHWPPPLADATSDGGAAAAATPGGGATGWQGFAAGGDPSYAAELQHLLVVLITLQRAAQHEQFSELSEASSEGPLLWVAEELAAPLADRLRHHFASGLPTDRPDRPEWLFATALKAAQQCCPLLQELQPCVEAHQLQAWYSVPLELARAVQAVGVNAIVKEHLLPQLVAAADPSLWLHYADEAMAFEKRFAVLRGASMALPEDEEFLGAAHPGSLVELLFQQPEWREGWLGAEAWDAARQLDASCDAYPAWHPAAEQLLAVAGQEADMVPDTPRSRGGAAWRREFWPPVCAEQVASLVSGLVRRGGWVCEQPHKLQYSQAVPVAVLRAFRERLSGLLLQAEQFRGMLGDTWLPRVGAAVCAAHYLEHQLREPQGVLLLAELQDAASSAHASSAHASSAAAGGDGAPTAEGTAAGAKGRSLAALLEREAGAFGALRKQWAYKLAKQAVDRFHQLFTPYKRNTAAFTVGWEQSAAEGDPALPAAPSPAMLLAADSVQQLLRALAQHLDAVVFRDVWKSVALAVNYSIYNEVATEALFSPQGAAQLDADLSAVSAVFGEFTSRPAAHFKESREACRLLGMPCDAALGLLHELAAAPRDAKRVLAPHGVKSLNAEQAGVVLMQRLDVLTVHAGHAGGSAAAGGGGVGA